MTVARLPRRDFLAAGAAAASLFAVESARGFQANDTLNVACLGTGGRSQRMLMPRVARIPNVRIAAVCDVWDGHLAAGAKLADPQAIREDTDFRRLLDRSDIDAVVIGSPDHWHVPMTIAACEAGKDVYVEKPLTHDLGEGEAVIAAQNKHKRIVQVGTQQRNMPHLLEAREILQSGALGKIHKISLSWNRNQSRWTRTKYGIDPSAVRWKQFLGNAPNQPFDEYRMRNWRWFWDFGGGIFTDLMVHWIDTAYWMLDMDNPATAMSIGDHFAAKGLWETPDTVQTLLTYPKQQLQAYFEGTFVNHQNRSALTFLGTDANLYCDRGRYEVRPERGKKVAARKRVDGKRDILGLDFYDEVDGALYHLREWVDCVRTRQQPSCPAEEGVRSAAAAHLANISYREGKVARWTGR
ncbi:MAG: Gfo/Idh/MocA family oxidoreductase [Pirellulaceae bacterium]|jgi:predicted dehydrogenase|nr:Gfo/Idh/MocA family oxidoreductase [Pirellulaceae bacterium]MDP7014326.1 Gfo/Idh/MocA family oxidoreductase [Pirellulaceae bacterium]